MRQRLSRPQRELLARRRIVRALEVGHVANMRTLEMKISDSGPLPQRIDPHVLTQARNRLAKDGHLKKVKGVWQHRSITPTILVQKRLSVLEPVYAATVNPDLKQRLGQTLEIAILKALQKGGLQFVGGFLDLLDHDDSILYKKEEPPLQISGLRMPGRKRFDFVAFHPTAGSLGIEAKNIREWMYPDRTEVKELLLKCIATDSIPVLITRRIPYVSFRLLGACGMMLFENYNQLYPDSAAQIAQKAADKELLGYHDIRVGSEPSPSLINFVGQTLVDSAPEFRERFNRYKDLLSSFATGEIYYASFAARVRRRELGIPEDTDDRPDEGDLDDLSYDDPPDDWR